MSSSFHVEQLMDALVAHLQNALSYAPALAAVFAETDTTIATWPPRRENYFLGTPWRYRGYKAPAVFFDAIRARRPLAATADDYAIDSYQHHDVNVIAIVEDQREERLERQCQRVAEVLETCLHDQDLYQPTVKTRSSKVFVPAIVIGDAWVSDPTQRAFRQDVRAELLVKHWN